MTLFSDKIREFRRRGVFRAGIAYLVGAWLLVQAADVLQPVFDMPEWIVRALIIALALGLPIALIVSWYFEITASGIKRTEDVPVDDPASPLLDRRSTFIIIALLVAGLSISIYGNFRTPNASRQLVTILIADFDNSSGNELFTGVLEDFLLIGLEAAPFVDAFSRKTAATIAADLPGTDDNVRTLNLENAALVALRQGVNIVIAGNVSRDDNALTVSVTGISAGDQQQLFSVTEQAKTDADILNTIASIAKKLRIKLGSTERPVGAGDSESFAVTNLEAAAEYLKAQDLQLNRRLEEAIVHYEKALLLDPDFTRAYAGLALTQQYLGNSDASTKNWEETLSRLNRLTERGRLRTLGNYFMINQQNYEKALETYESLVEKYPADNVAQNNLAVTAFYAMDFTRALDVGRDVAQRFPNHNGYRANLALYAMYASRFEEAYDEAQTVIDNDASSAYAFLVLALTSAVSGDIEAAEDAYRQMNALDQFGRSVASEGLADLAVYRGELDEAIRILDAAIEQELAQNSVHAAAIKRVMKAEVLQKTHDDEQARELLDAALSDANGDPAVLVPAALLLVDLGNSPQARIIAADLSQSLSKPRRAYADIVLAWDAAADGKFDVAIGLANSAVETEDLWLVRFIRAKIFLQAGMQTEATADLQVCKQRIGEGIAVFLTDRPSFRLVRDLEIAVAETTS